MDREARLALAEPNPELVELEKHTPSRGLDSAEDIFKAREHLTAMKKQMTAANVSEDRSFVEEDRKITTRDGASIAIRVHSPATSSPDGHPGLIMLHGGGFCLGGLDNEVATCRKWTQLGGVAVNVDYRLAPENPFPAAVNDAYDALKWTSEHLDELKINPAKGYIVGGVSAGANLTAVITHLYHDDSLSPKLTGQYLSIPAVCDPAALPARYKDRYLSREQNKNALILNRKSTDLFESLYKPDPLSPLRSPLIFPSHEGMPPCYFQICGADPLRDEGLIYEEQLREEYGIKTKLDIFPGLPHGFWTWFPKAEFSKDFQIKTEQGLKWLLEQSV